MGGIESLVLFLIVMYVLFAIARRLWPKRENDERTTAPFVKRRQRAMIWATVLVGVALVSTSTMWSTPQMFPQQISGHQHWLMTGPTGTVSVRGRTRGWVPPFTGREMPEPETIEFEGNQNRFDIRRESVSAPWTDLNGVPVDADDVIARLGVDAEHKPLIDAALTESWGENGLERRVQSNYFQVMAMQPRPISIVPIAKHGPGGYSQEPAIIGIMVAWVVAGILIVTGLGFDRWKFKQREPSDTVFA